MPPNLSKLRLCVRALARAEVEAVLAAPREGDQPKGGMAQAGEAGTVRAPVLGTVRAGEAVPVVLGRGARVAVLARRNWVGITA